MTFANQLTMDVFVPALVFYVLSAKSFALASYGFLALGGLILVLGSGVVLLPLVGVLRLRLSTFLPPMMFVNSGNMGLPLAVFAFGEGALPAAVVLFLVSTLLHFTVGQYLMDHTMHIGRLARMPLIYATAAGLLVSLAGWSLPALLATPIEMLGQIAIPLMLFSLGVRLVDLDLRDWRIGLLGAFACPLSGVALALLVMAILPLPLEQSRLLLVFGALPPAVINYIFAETYNQEPAKVASVVMLGNLLSLVTIPAILLLALR